MTCFARFPKAQPFILIKSVKKLNKHLQNQKNYDKINELKAKTEPAYPSLCITERPMAESGHARGAPFTPELAR